LVGLIKGLTASTHRVLFVKFVSEWVDKIHEKSDAGGEDE